MSSSTDRRAQNTTTSSQFCYMYNSRNPQRKHIGHTNTQLIDKIILRIIVGTLNITHFKNLIMWFCPIRIRSLSFSLLKSMSLTKERTSFFPILTNLGQITVNFWNSDQLKADQLLTLSTRRQYSSNRHLGLLFSTSYVPIMPSGISQIQHL